MKPIRVGAGTVRFTGGMGGEYVYEEAGRQFRAAYDGRETGSALVVVTQAWSAPEGAPVSPEERERIYDALWKAHESGYILEAVRPFVTFVPVRWDRDARGFLLKMWSDFDYMELHHVLELQNETAIDPVTKQPTTTVHVPEQLVWSWPKGEPVSREARDRIVTRLRSATDEDVWNGSLGTLRVVIGSS